MKIVEVSIHNFRSIADATFRMHDYTLLVGANNCGKSNIVDAIRIFYDHLKFEPRDDFPRFHTTDRESWIEIEFQLAEEEFNRLSPEYRLGSDRMKVRRYLQVEERDGGDGRKPGLYGYIGNNISEKTFCSGKELSQGRLGRIIFIEAASRLEDHTKMTSKSTFRDLVNDIVEDLLKTSRAYARLMEEFKTFDSEFKSEKVDGGRSLSGLQENINDMIKYWNVSLEINIDPIGSEELVKNLISFKIRDHALDAHLEATQFGMGLQRQLIFALINLRAEYATPNVQADKNEFLPALTLFLFEEPEAFLHPPQQKMLARSLRRIASTEGNQVLVTTHSSNFVSLNIEEVTSIVRLGRDCGRTQVGQILPQKMEGIIAGNQKINELVSIGHDEDRSEEMEVLKYCLWLGPDRCEMFFSGQVILVEGPTERALLNYLFDIGEVEVPQGGVSVLDCMGKYNIHRFMNLLGALRIHHSVIFDGDCKKPSHRQINQLIRDSSNDYTQAIEEIPEDLETLLDLKKVRSDQKPQYVMLNVIQRKVAPDRMHRLACLVKKIVRYS